MCVALCFTIVVQLTKTVTQILNIRSICQCVKEHKQQIIILQRKGYFYLIKLFIPLYYNKTLKAFADNNLLVFKFGDVFQALSTVQMLTKYCFCIFVPCLNIPYFT